MADTVEHPPTTEADTVEVYPDTSGQHRWRRQAPNGEIISVSGESYTREWDAHRAAKRANPDALVMLPASPRRRIGAR